VCFYSLFKQLNYRDFLKKKKKRISFGQGLGVVTCGYNPSYVGDGERRIGVQGQLGKRARPYLKNTQN
jgi:hypothetical protein